MLGACTGGSQNHSRLRRGPPFPCSFDTRAFQHRAQRSYSWCSISLGEHFLIFPHRTHLPTVIVNLMRHPPRSVTLFRLSMLLFNWWTWRGSNPVASLIPRNLLILRNGRNAKKYTAGTRTPESRGRASPRSSVLT